VYRESNKHAGRTLSDTIRTPIRDFFQPKASNYFHLTFAGLLSSLHPSPHGYQSGHMPQNHQGWEHSSRRVCRHRAWDRVCELRAQEQGWRWKVREAVGGGGGRGALNVPSKKGFSKYDSCPPPVLFFFPPRLSLSLSQSVTLVKAYEFPPPPSLLSQPLSPWPIAHSLRTLFLCSVLSTLAHSLQFVRLQKRSCFSTVVLL